MLRKIEHLMPSNERNGKWETLKKVQLKRYKNAKEAENRKRRFSVSIGGIDILTRL